MGRSNVSIDLRARRSPHWVLLLPLLGAVFACGGPRTQVQASAPEGPAPGAPIARAVVIGISTYQSGSLPQIPHAETDAAAFARQLEDSGTSVKLLSGARADRRDIIDTVAAVRAASGPGDVNLIYFNGHVSTPVDKEGTAMLLPYRARTQALGRTAIDFETLLDAVATDESGARWLLLVDCAHYGVKGPARPPLLNAAMRRVLFKRPALSVLLAGAGSMTDNRWSIDGGGAGGVYTFLLVKGLRGGADVNGDGKVEGAELATYVIRGAQDATAGGQVPEALGAPGQGVVLAQVEAGQGAAPAAAPAAGSAPPARKSSGIATFKDYQELNDLNCLPRITEVDKPEERSVGGLKLRLRGTRAEVIERDADKRVRLGLIGAIKDAEPGTQRNLQGSLDWFKAEKVDAVVVNGDTGYDELEIRDSVEKLAKSGLPTFIVIGNSETIGALHGAIDTVSERYDNLVNMDLVRFVDLDDVVLVSLPGYFNKAFIHASGGCGYRDRHVEEVGELAGEAKAPVALISHGPPKGRSKASLDYAEGAGNVGDPRINQVMKKAGIRIGVFGHILEAGGQGRSLGDEKVPEGKLVDSLMLNMGSLSSIPWTMNTGKMSSGMAAILTVDDGQVKYEFKALKGN